MLSTLITLSNKFGLFRKEVLSFFGLTSQQGKADSRNAIVFGTFSGAVVGINQPSKFKFISSF
jgi:hypothetical protein